MATQIAMASVAILSLLLVSHTSAAYFNALCDSSLNWVLDPSEAPYNFNPAACKATLASNSVNGDTQRAVIDVSSIISTASYPLNVTVTAYPEGPVDWGIVIGDAGDESDWEYKSEYKIGDAGDENGMAVSISLKFSSSTDTYYSYYYNWPGMSVGNGGAMMSFQPQYIKYVGFFVDKSTISANEHIDFLYVTLNGLTISPTQYTTDVPTTAEPTKQPTNIPTINPSQNPSISPSTTTTIEPSISPSFIPSNYPSELPSLYPSIYPSEVPSLYPSVSPTTRPSFECNQINLALVQISFNYELQQATIGSTEIDMHLTNITDDLIQQKNSSLNGCFISKYKTDIKTYMNIMKAAINVSMCTTCGEQEIQRIFNDFKDLAQDTTIIAVTPDSISIDVDVVIMDNSGEATASTTEAILNTSKTTENGDDTAWIILAVLGSIVCVCILCAVARVLALRRRDKATDDKLHEGVSMMRVLTHSVADNEQENVMKTGQTEEENTGSNEQYNKGTHSSHNVEDDEGIIGTPGNMLNDDIIIGDEEDVGTPGDILHDVGTPGNILNNDEIIIDGDDENEVGTPGDMLRDDIIIGDEDESPTNNDSVAISDDPNGNNNIILENTDNGDNKYKLHMNEYAQKVKNWLEETVGFPQYLDNFVNNGYERMDFIMEITDKSELKAIGIDLMGHRVAIMAKINALKNNGNLLNDAEYDLTLEGD